MRIKLITVPLVGETAKSSLKLLYRLNSRGCLANWRSPIGMPAILCRARRSSSC